MINISLVKFELLFSLLSACLDSDTRVFGPLLACCSFTPMGGWWRTRRLKWWRKEKNQWAVKPKSIQEEQTRIHQHLVATLHIKKTLNPKTPRLYPPSTQSPVTTPPLHMKFLLFLWNRWGRLFVPVTPPHPSRSMSFQRAFQLPPPWPASNRGAWSPSQEVREGSGGGDVGGPSYQLCHIPTSRTPKPSDSRRGGRWWVWGGFRMTVSPRMHPLQRMMGEHMCRQKLCDSVFPKGSGRPRTYQPGWIWGGGVGLALYMDTEVWTIRLHGCLWYTVCRGSRCVWSAVAMLMLLSLCVVLVEAEQERNRDRLDWAFCHSWHQRWKVGEETAAICRTGGRRGLWSPYPRYHCGEIKIDVNIWTALATTYRTIPTAGTCRPNLPRTNQRGYTYITKVSKISLRLYEIFPPCSLQDGLLCGLLLATNQWHCDWSLWTFLCRWYIQLLLL